MSQAGSIGSGGSGGSGIQTIDGNTGSVTGTTVTLQGTTAASGASVTFSGSAATMTLNMTDANACVFIGGNAGSGALANSVTHSVGIGQDTLSSGTLTGSANIAIGHQSLKAATTTANSNVGIGVVSLTGLTTGINNIAVGTSTGNALTTGTGNTLLGDFAGHNYTSSESYNICLGAEVQGTLGESHVLRVGSGTGTGTAQLNTAFISGINGNTVSSAKMVTINSSTDQLGVANIPTGVFPWTDENTNFSPVTANGYFVTSTATATLPASPSQGDTISFIVDTTNVLTITANTGQVIRIGSGVSASAGTAASTARGDSITLVYRSSDTAWISLTAPQGTWTLT